MRSLNNFIVEIEKELNDEMVTEGGLKLYVDTKYNEFDHRTTEGKVLATPIKFDTGVNSGDTLYFHHHVVINGGSPLNKKDKQYVVNYNEEHAAQNQAIAYKDGDKGDVHPLYGWALLEPVKESPEGPEEKIELIKLEESPVTQGVVSFSTQELDEIGVSNGDVVGFKKNRDYRIKIDGKEYYRVAVSELLYKV
jgi:co-chaperonin GroES (HSP10)